MNPSAPPPATAGRSHRTGAILVVCSTVAWSFSGIFTRLLSTDVMSAITLRSLFGGLFLLIVFTVLNGRQTLAAFTRIRAPDVALMIAQGICQACTVGAFYKTTIANTAIIYATAPFIAAGFAYYFVGERLSGRTLIACLVAFLGVMIIVSSGFGAGHMVGDLIALLMTTTFALIIVIPRAYPGTDMMPATVVSAILTSAAFFPFSHLGGVSPADWIVLAAFGLMNFTVAMYLFLAGSRRIPAAQAGLIGTLEIVLSPFWVWFVFNERPAAATILGGGMILAVVVWHTAREWQDARQVGVAA